MIKCRNCLKVYHCPCHNTAGVNNFEWMATSLTCASNAVVTCENLKVDRMTPESSLKIFKCSSSRTKKHAPFNYQAGKISCLREACLFRNFEYVISNKENEEKSRVQLASLTFCAS